MSVYVYVYVTPCGCGGGWGIGGITPGAVNTRRGITYIYIYVHIHTRDRVCRICIHILFSHMYDIRTAAPAYTLMYVYICI